jgi:hypothetical protein
VLGDQADGSTNWDILLGTHMSREEAENRVGARPKKLEDKTE